jgi:hypothetical protein
MEPSTSTDTTTNRTFGTLRKKPLTRNNVVAVVLLLGCIYTFLVVDHSYTSLFTYAPGSDSQKIQTNEDANRNVLPTNTSVPEKKDTSASVLLHDDVVSQTTEIIKADGTVLPKHKSVPEKKDTSALAVLHDDVAPQTTEINKANMALEKKESIPNRVTHLMKKPEFQINDAYSGMWWVSPVSR